MCLLESSVYRGMYGADRVFSTPEVYLSTSEGCSIHQRYILVHLRDVQYIREIMNTLGETIYNIGILSVSAGHPDLCRESTFGHV